jgi:hypothetical protein
LASLADLLSWALKKSREVSRLVGVSANRRDVRRIEGASDRIGGTDELR